MCIRDRVTPLLGLSAAEIEDLAADETAWETWVERFREWQTVWRQRGFLPDLVQRLAGVEEGMLGRGLALVGLRLDLAAGQVLQAGGQLLAQDEREVAGQTLVELPSPVAQDAVGLVLGAVDELVGVTTVDAVRSAGGHSMVTTRTELATTAGDAVATSTSTIVVRGGEE